jgi:hypothetical protein
MAFQNLWQRWRKGGVEETAFAKWPPIPEPQSAPTGKLGQLPAWTQVSGQQANSRKYGPAIVIGLGDSGDLILRAWLNKMAQDPAGEQEYLRSMLLTRAAKPRLPDGAVRRQAFDLLTYSAYTPETAVYQATPTRQEAYELFRNPHTFEPVWRFLSRAVDEIKAATNQGRGIRLILAASAVEAEIALLGDLLHILSRLERQSFANITLLLTLESPAPVLEDAEMYAVLREIGRMTFGGGWHWMPPFPIDQEQSSGIQGSALDAVFVVEAGAVTGMPVELRAVTPWQVTCEAIAETIYALLHPSSQTIWEKLLPALITSGSARQETRQPFFHSLGIATLYVPVDEIKAYAATRLTRAVLFGEAGVAEGLLAQATDAVGETLLPGVICRQWFSNRHPFFGWLFDLNDVAQLRRLPALDNTQPYLDFFQSVIAAGLAELLNDRRRSDHLQIAQDELSWLKRRLQEVLALSLAAKGTTAADDNQRLQYILDNYLKVVDWLAEQIVAWRAVLLGGDPANVNEIATPMARQSSPLLTDWRAALQADADSSEAERSEDEDKPQPFISARAILETKRTEIEAELSAIAKNEIYRPLTADEGGSLSEVEGHYRDSIRPELSRFDLKERPRFAAIRERLGWCIEIARDRLPRIYLVCLPADQKADKGIIPRNALYLPTDAARFMETVLSLARYQVRDVDKILTGDWMSSRLQSPIFHAFWGRASRPFLNYRPEDATRLYSGAATSLRCLIGANQQVTQPHLKAAFPIIGEEAINQIKDGETSRVTAVGFRLNLPLDCITRLQQAYEQYGHREERHLYRQEKLAVRYENMLRRIRRDIYLLPAELSMALVDERLVNLFCQAVFYQVIQERFGGVSSNGRYWQLPFLLDPEPEKDQWTPMNSASITEYADKDQEWRSLFDALRWFTVENILAESFSLNPSHPLHPRQRERYYQKLFDETRRRSRSQGHLLAEFEKKYLEKWENQAEKEPMGRAFLDLLKIETKRPLPVKW